MIRYKRYIENVILVTSSYSSVETVIVLNNSDFEFDCS